MTDTCPIVRIKADNEDGFTEINASDFDATKHTLVDDQEPVASGRVEAMAQKMFALTIEIEKLAPFERDELEKRMSALVEKHASDRANNLSFDFGGERELDTALDGERHFEGPPVVQPAADGFAAPPAAEPAPAPAEAVQEPAEAVQEPAATVETATAEPAPAADGFAAPAATPTAPKKGKAS